MDANSHRANIIVTSNGLVNQHFFVNWPEDHSAADRLSQKEIGQIDPTQVRATQGEIESHMSLNVSAILIC